jgi:hypothetical protein
MSKQAHTLKVEYPSELAQASDSYIGTLTPEQIDKLWLHRELIRRYNAHDALVAVEKVLRQILRAHDCAGNGAVMGEAKLCTYFADLARAVLAEVESNQRSEP